MGIKSISKTKASILNLLFNYANVAFGIINGLILVPLYLEYFSVATYGSYLSSGNIVGMLGLLEGGMSFVLTQKLSLCYGRKDFSEFSKILGSGLFISLVIVTFLILIGFLFFPFISDWVKAEPNEYKNIQYAFLFSAVGAGLNIFFHNISSVFQSLLKVNTSGFANVISTLVGIITTLVGLKVGYGVVSIPLGLFAKGLVGVLVLIIGLKNVFKKEKFPRMQVDKFHIRELLLSVLPMFGGGIAKSLVTNSQLLIITNFINPTASAVFFITSRIFIVCDSFLSPIGSSIFASISQIVGEGDRILVKKNIVNIFFIFNVFSIFILSSTLILNSSFVSVLLGKDKYGGDLLSLLLCINMLFYTRFNFLSINLYALGVFGKTVMYDIIGGILRLVIIFSLINFIGYVALPIAEFISTTFLLGYFLNKLIVNKIGLEGAEVFKFVFSGGFLVLILFPLCFIWLRFLPEINSWKSFGFYSILIGLLNGAVILIFSKKTKVYLIRSLRYLVFKN